MQPCKMRTFITSITKETNIVLGVALKWDKPLISSCSIISSCGEMVKIWKEFEIIFKNVIIWRFFTYFWEDKDKTCCTSVTLSLMS